MEFQIRATLGLALAFLAACGSSSGDVDYPGIDAGGGGPSAAAAVNGWQLEVDPDTGAWSISERGGGAVLRSASSASPVRVATGEPEVKSAYGSFQIALTGEDSGLSWRSPPEKTPELRRDGEGASLVWSLGEGTGDAGDSGTVRLEIRPADGDDLRVSLRTEGVEADAGEFNLACSERESFFGLGTQVTGLDLRGRIYPLWTQEQGIGKPEDGGLFPINRPPEAAYAPMGVWHSSAGYSAVVDRDSYGEVDFCSEGDAIRLRNYEHMPSYTFVLEGEPKRRVRRVTDYTGRLEDRPPPWVFGPWLSAVGGPWRLEEVSTTLRDRDIPVTAIWTEDWIGWEETGTGRRLSFAWEWNRDAYPNLPSRVESLHDRGFAFLGYFNPFVPQSTKMWDEGDAGGYLVQDSSGETSTLKDPGMRTAGLIELSNDDAIRWLQDYQRRAISEVGLDGWMADYAEWYPLEAEPEGDVSSWVFHNRYPVEWVRANRGSFEAERSGSSGEAERVFFARSGWASTNGGSGAVAPAMWAGDQQTNWTRHDGLPSVVPIIAHAGLSGVPIMGSDIGGYSSVGTEPRDMELYVRWAALSAFHPLMRGHHGDEECENWSFDRDEETLEHFERYASIHNLLYPYLASRLTESMDSGVPITRHPWLVEPEHPTLWSGDDWLYFLGDDLLVAPILEEGATERTVELPGRKWWPLFGGDSVGERADEAEEGVRVEASAPVTEIPVFVRPGTILPLLRTPVDSLYGATDDDVTDLGDRSGAYRLALYPDGSGDAQLDGVEGLDVVASGLPGSRSPGETTAELAGESLPNCAEVSAESCVNEEQGLVQLKDVEDAELAVADGTVDIASDEPVDLTIGFGGAAWEEWANPTALENLDSSAPSYCERAPDK